jgi:hypothetical protein
MCPFRPVTEQAFDIHADLFGDGTGLDEEAGDDYERNLARLFEESPEGQAVAVQGVELGFAGTIVHYLLRYGGVSIPEMTDLQFETVIYQTVPAKVTVEPSEARGMILEARGFCRYLARAHRLENAEECLAIVDGDDAIEALDAALANPATWGMAKSMMMEGKARGFDLSSKDGIEQWMSAYNASLPAGATRPSGPTLAPVSRRTEANRRNKRKQQRAARRKNR